jgi:predicted TIM-barrel fold metal-dependent hydrolase
MIIDVHHHCLPINVYREFHDPAAPPKRVLIDNNDFTFAPKLHSIETHLRDMDFAGVDMSLLTIAQYANLASPDLCRRINEGYAEIVAARPDRFIATGCVPVYFPEQAGEEIDYIIKELKFPAITLLTSQGADLTMSTREKMWPIYEKMAKYDIPAFLHPHLKPAGIELEFTINRSIGRGFDATKGALRIMYDVFTDFPDLKFVLPHYGGVLLAMKGRIMNFYEPAEELGISIPKEIGSMSRTPLELDELKIKPAFDKLFDKLYIDGAGSAGWEPITKLAMMTVKHDHLMWGTDYPYEIHAGRDMKYYIDSVMNLDIPEEDKKGFLGGNAARLLKIMK